MSTPDWVQDAIFYQIFPIVLQEAATTHPPIYRLNPGSPPRPRMDLKVATCTESLISWITCRIWESPLFI